MIFKKVKFDGDFAVRVSTVLFTQIEVEINNYKSSSDLRMKAILGNTVHFPQIPSRHVIFALFPSVWSLLPSWMQRWKTWSVVLSACVL